MRGAQLRALLWLRWRLTRNQWRRSGELNAVVTLIAVAIALVVALLAGIGGVAIGALGLADASSRTVMLVWDGLVAGFLLFWMVGLATDLQRSEVLDLGRLLHLPISVRDVFVLNYLSSLFSLSLAAVLPAMLGLAAGLVLGRGTVMSLIVPLVFGFFLMITAWTYCLRGWLATLMTNKRRRRAIVMGITMTIILLCQLPNLVMNVWFTRHHDNPSQPVTVQEQAQRHADEQLRMMAVLETAHRWVPLLWLPQGAGALVEGRVWPAVWGALGMSAIGTWGLVRAYRSTLRFCQGGDTGKLAKAEKVVPARPAGRKLLVERTLPLVPDDAAALALTGLRSMSRAPEVKMALASNVVIFAILAASMLLRSSEAPSGILLPLVASGTVAVSFLGLAQMMFNQFGFDRTGFRQFVLLPTPRRHILLGKNLALLPVAMLIFAIYLTMVIVLARVGLADVLAAVFEFAGAMAVLSAIGNVISIFVPYRMASGSWKPTKTSSVTQLLIFVSHLLLPVALAPVFVPALLGLAASYLADVPCGPVTVVAAAVFAALAGWLYWQTLGLQGRLLERREKEIVLVVTQEVE